MAKPLFVFITGTLTFGLLWSLALMVLSKIILGGVKNEKEKKERKTMAVWLVTLAVLLMYTMWLCGFFHQMYPLIIPDLTISIEKELLESGLLPKPAK